MSKAQAAAKITPNVPLFDRQLCNDGRRILAPAPEDLRVMAQEIIDTTHEHRHLRLAKILLLCESSEAVATKLDKGERVVIGRATRCNALQRVLAGGPALRGQEQGGVAQKDPLAAFMPGFDFMVKLSADWLERVGFNEGLDEGVLKAQALVDHELLHCGVRIAGVYLAPAELPGFVKDLGERWEETCHDIVNTRGEILVRYQMERAWKMRRHDLEEFAGVVRRWGAWDRAVGSLVDVIVHRQEKHLPLMGFAEDGEKESPVLRPQTSGAAARSASAGLP